MGGGRGQGSPTYSLPMPSPVALQQGWTALHYAAFKGHLPLVLLLLHQGADIEAMTADGKWAGLIAEEEGEESCFEELCRARGEVGFPCVWGLSLTSKSVHPVYHGMWAVCQPHAGYHGNRLSSGGPGGPAAASEGVRVPTGGVTGVSAGPAAVTSAGRDGGARQVVSEGV